MIVSALGSHGKLRLMCECLGGNLGKQLNILDNCLYKNFVSNQRIVRENKGLSTEYDVDLAEFEQVS